MEIKALLQKLAHTPDSVEFDEVINTIDAGYEFKPASFSNGEIKNEAGSNSGSCKILAFGLLNNLSQEEVLACFGTYYRNDVLKHPNGSDHANIRNFMNSGWDGVEFSTNALTLKA